MKLGFTRSFRGDLGLGLKFPSVGPFEGKQNLPISELPSLHITGATSRTFFLNRIENFPQYNKVIIETSAQLSAPYFGVIIWCNELVLKGEIRADGAGVSDVDSLPGSGGSGGGSGGDFEERGAAGGSGVNGDAAISDGGSGYCNTVYNADLPPFGPYGYPFGGDGGEGGSYIASGGEPGFATDGCGGGGGGGAGGNTLKPYGIGGGGGGGLICIICNKLSGSGTLVAQGGKGGRGFSVQGTGGGGGGGSILVYTRSYTGSVSAYVTGGPPGSSDIDPMYEGKAGLDGTASIYEVSGVNESLAITPRTFVESWDNL